MPDLMIKDSQPLSTDTPLPSTDQKHQPENLHHWSKTPIKPPPASRKKLVSAIENFVLTQTPTCPLPLLVTARKHNYSGSNFAEADLRKVLMIISDGKPK